MPKMATGAPASGANLNMFVNSANGVALGAWSMALGLWLPFEYYYYY